MPDSLSRFAALGAALAERGLGVQLPLAASAFDDLAAAAGKPPLRAHWREARGGLLVGSGGTTFFERFRQSPVAGEHPFDAFTRREMELCCSSVLGPGGFELAYPFMEAQPALPFQLLGRLAGTPAPGPLGVVVLRDWGPWWAFRAFVLLPFDVPMRPRQVDLCASCAAPCVEACPGGAVFREGFVPGACVGHRGQSTDCRDRCVARRACPVAPQHAYGPEQAMFHMRALNELTRAFRPASASARS